MSEWTDYKLGEIITLNYGKSLVADKRIPGAVPVYSSSGITGWHNAALVNSEGLIVGRKGTVGTVYYSETPFYCIDTAYFVLPNPKRYNLKFLYYLLHTLGLENLNEDSAVPGLNRETAYNQEIKLPDLTTQTAIAEILSSLDVKIELNNQINKNLEALAQALFKRWFVDFEFPNENGQPYKSSGGDMVESELGMIPKGWRVGKILDLFELQRGHDLPTDNRKNGFVPVYSASGLHGYHNESKADSPGVITGRSGVIGKVFFINQAFWPLNTVLYVKEFRIASPVFAFYFLQGLDLNSLNAGSAVPTLNRNDVHGLMCSVPPKEIIDTFSANITANLELIDSMNREIRFLVDLRDTLLPRVISGELSIK